METLIFVLTLRCPLECAHCIVDSGPTRREVLDSMSVLRAIEEAASLGIKTIGFTGGEPFLRRAELEAYYQRATNLGLESVIVTSGFFGTSQETAVEYLKPFSGVSMLGISSDAYHQQYVDISRIKNTLGAAVSLGIARIEIQIAYLSDVDLDEAKQQLGELPTSVQVRAQPIWPVGRAQHLTQSIGKSLSELNLNCPMVGPVVWPDGSVYGCCSALLRLGKENPFSFGNIKKDTLSHVRDNVKSDAYYSFVKKFGLLPVTKFIQDNSGDILLKRYTSACHLCHDIHSDSDLRSKIALKMQMPQGVIADA